MRGLLALAAIVLTVHLAQHVAEGIADPAWFFGLGVVGAAGLWTTAALWPRGSQAAQTLVLVLLGVGLVVGGLALHLRDAFADGLTATHTTGVLAGLFGVVLLTCAAARMAGGRSAH